MPAIAATELILIRHAPALTQGRMAGRRDVGADCSNAQTFADLRVKLDTNADRITSPAQRCRETAASLWPDQPAPATDARLWEQDFGTWEGLPFADLPDLGSLSLPDLAQHRPPQGESFADVCARVQPALLSFTAAQSVLIVHAGVIRAALGLALGLSHLGLSFQIAPLSLTRLIRIGSVWSIACVNEPPR